MPKNDGFTLAELLIALAILGVIAVFSIPKVLQSQTNSKYKAIAKEAVSMVSAAYEAYKQENVVNTTTKLGDLTPYMNYVKVDNTTIVDYLPTLTTINCAFHNCLKLHNGAILWYWAPEETFVGTSNTHAIDFFIDPDGESVGGNLGKSGEFFLYYNGRISSRAHIANPSLLNGVVFTPSSTYEPDWFAWN